MHRERGGLGSERRPGHSNHYCHSAEHHRNSFTGGGSPIRLDRNRFEWYFCYRKFRRDCEFGLALVPDKNFTGLVTFACTNLPSNSVCTIAPPSANVTNGSHLSVSIAIKTGQNLSAQTHKVPLKQDIAFAILPALLLLLRSSGYRRARRFGSAALLLSVLYCCTSCSSGSGNMGTGGGGSTPYGTHTVVVTAASAGNTAQNIDLTVKAQ